VVGGVPGVVVGGGGPGVVVGGGGGGVPGVVVGGGGGPVPGVVVGGVPGVVVGGGGPVPAVSRIKKHVGDSGRLRMKYATIGELDVPFAFQHVKQQPSQRTIDDERVIPSIFADPE
jgi:hypothetical protein